MTDYLKIEDKLILNKGLDPSTLDKLPYSRVIDLIQSWEEELKMKQKNAEKEQKEYETSQKSYSYNPSGMKFPAPPQLPKYKL